MQNIHPYRHHHGLVGGSTTGPVHLPAEDSLVVTARGHEVAVLTKLYSIDTTIMGQQVLWNNVNPWFRIKFLFSTFLYKDLSRSHLSVRNLFSTSSFAPAVRRFNMLRMLVTFFKAIIANAQNTEIFHFSWRHIFIDFLAHKFPSLLTVCLLCFRIGLTY